MTFSYSNFRAIDAERHISIAKLPTRPQPGQTEVIYRSKKFSFEFPYFWRLQGEDGFVCACVVPKEVLDEATTKSFLEAFFRLPDRIEIEQIHDDVRSGVRLLASRGGYDLVRVPDFHVAIVPGLAARGNFRGFPGWSYNPIKISEALDRYNSGTM